MDMHRKNSHITFNLYGDSIVHTSTFHQSQLTPILGPSLEHTYYQNLKKLIITLGLDFLLSTYYWTFWRVSKMNIHFHFSSTYAWIPHPSTIVNCSHLNNKYKNEPNNISTLFQSTYHHNSHLPPKGIIPMFFGVVHKLLKCKQTFKFSYLSLVDLDLEYESIMQIGFPYAFPLPSWPKITIGKHLLIEIEKQTTFHFSSVSCHFQKTLCP